MKLARSRTAEGIVPVAEVDGRWYDLRPIASALNRGADTPLVTPEVRQRIQAAVAAGELPAVGEPAEFAAPVAGIGKVVCIGLNYGDHADETGATPPAEPVIFMKAPDTVVGPA